MNGDRLARNDVLNQGNQGRRPPAFAERAVRMKAEHVERFIGHLDDATDEILLCQRPTHRLNFRPNTERLIDSSSIVLFGLGGRDVLGAVALDHDADGPKYVNASWMASPIEQPRCCLINSMMSPPQPFS